MKIRRRAAIQSLLAAAAIVTLPPAVQANAADLAAPPSSPAWGTALQVDLGLGGTWEALGPNLPIRRLFGPATGALLAANDTALYRSDDVGASWHPVPLPPTTRGRRAIEVDPTNHAVVFADSDDGLQVSRDEGATWAPILPSARVTLRVAASAADPNLLYVVQTGTGSIPSDVWFFRSRDGGQTFEQLDEQHNSMCGWGVRIIQPHPTDPSRIFQTSGCYAGRDASDDLQESRDQGTSWRSLIRPSIAFPTALAGGAGAEPSRFFLAANRDARTGGSLVLTSANDGASWQEILSFTGGGTMGSGSAAPSITIGALAYDAGAPARVFVALNRRAGPARGVEGAEVTASIDGGQTWGLAGTPGLPEVSDLLLGIDARYLFAATVEGVRRLAVG